MAQAKFAIEIVVHKDAVKEIEGPRILADVERENRALKAAVDYLLDRVTPDEQEEALSIYATFNRKPMDSLRVALHASVHQLRIFADTAKNVMAVVSPAMSKAMKAQEEEEREKTREALSHHSISSPQPGDTIDLIGGVKDVHFHAEWHE